MKKLFFSATLLVLVFFQSLANVSLNEFLARKEVKEVRSLSSEPAFEQILEVMIEQPVDHHNPDGAKFTQRVYISHVDASKPVVLVTAGYDAKYYYTTEITSRLKCNQVMVEHRYFGRSVPDSIDWNYLDTWQAASDHHQIIAMLKELYPGPWISTGISKGGQTVIYHSYYYPEDVDVRVPYVAPLNFGREDQRIYSFLEHVGSAKERKKIEKFQKMALKNEEQYLDAFKSFTNDKGYTFNLAGGVEKAYEYCVLEYSFAYWQWGYVPMNKIPGRAAGPEEVIDHMNRVAGFDYFSDQFITEYRPFFYQAMTEMGYYGYDLEPFEKYLNYVDNPVFTFTIPENIKISFDDELSYDIRNYIAEEAENFIFIYGENDTWSATAVTSTGSTNSRIFIKKGGSHRTRINNMPEEQQVEVYATLASFLQNSSTSQTY